MEMAIPVVDILFLPTNIAERELSPHIWDVAI
jgi:hypothetical protein